MEDDAVVVPIPRMCRPVLHSLGALVGKELDMDVPPGAVNDSSAGQGTPLPL